MKPDPQQQQQRAEAIEALQRIADRHLRQQQRQTPKPPVPMETK